MKIGLRCFVVNDFYTQYSYIFILYMKAYSFSERELTFMFAICRRASVCRLSVVCL